MTQAKNKVVNKVPERISAPQIPSDTDLEGVLSVCVSQVSAAATGSLLTAPRSAVRRRGSRLQQVEPHAEFQGSRAFR